MRRGNPATIAGQPEAELTDTASLRMLGEAISRDVSDRSGLRNVGRAIWMRLVDDGAERPRTDLFLRSFRVTHADHRGYSRSSFDLRGLTRNGPRRLLVLDGTVLYQPPSQEHVDYPVRPLAASERAALLVALSRPAIARLPNRYLRTRAQQLRRARPRRRTRGSRRPAAVGPPEQSHGHPARVSWRRAAIWKRALPASTALAGKRTCGGKTAVQGVAPHPVSGPPGPVSGSDLLFEPS